MNIINVIRMEKGVLESIDSYLLPNDLSETKRQELIKQAEALFIQKVREIWIGEEDAPTEEDLDDIGDNYDNENGREVLLVWSHNIHQ